mmetsp:Transcript_52703/g.126894  ORF Transcript_52703/g.126894 Transcript_52703/m.126894 type:complete len:234 (-) Transcript_52703:216-917(-)
MGFGILGPFFLRTIFFPFFPLPLPTAANPACCKAAAIPGGIALPPLATTPVRAASWACIAISCAFRSSTSSPPAAAAPPFFGLRLRFSKATACAAAAAARCCASFKARLASRSRSRSATLLAFIASRSARLRAFSRAACSRERAAASSRCFFRMSFCLRSSSTRRFVWPNRSSNTARSLEADSYTGCPGLLYVSALPNTSWMSAANASMSGYCDLCKLRSIVEKSIGCLITSK